MAKLLSIISVNIFVKWVLFLVLILLVGNGEASRFDRWESTIRLPTEKDETEELAGEVGTRWAVLVAGSSGYGNYRHQVCVYIYKYIHIYSQIIYAALV